jgi:hypothetical protein
LAERWGGYLAIAAFERTAFSARLPTNSDSFDVALPCKPASVAPETSQVERSANHPEMHWLRMPSNLLKEEHYSI